MQSGERSMIQIAGYCAQTQYIGAPQRGQRGNGRTAGIAHQMEPTGPCL